MAARFAEHILHQLRRAVGDLRLVGKGGRAVDEHAKLDHLLHAVEGPKGGLHLREQHYAAAAGSGDTALKVDILAQPAFDQASVVGEADLTGDVEESVLFHGGNIGSHGRGGLRQGDSEFGKALVDTHAVAPSTRLRLN